MRKRWMGLYLFLIILMIVPVIAHAESPLDVIQTEVNKVLEVLRTQGESKASKEMKIWSIIDQIFDYTELSKLALANYWRAFTPEQQKEFTTLFRRLLGGYYMERIMAYTTEKEVFGKEIKLSENMVEIQSELITQTKSVLINYRMIHEKGKWKVYDVVIEGVSLVMNYRSQFREILANKSPQDLLKMLREKVRQ